MDGDSKLFDRYEWTAERDAQMLELRAGGMLIADMGTWLGCGFRAVKYRLEVLKPPRLKHPTWTDARDEYLREHYPAGKPAHDIALKLGLNKNQVIGRAGRLGLRHGKRPEDAICTTPYVRTTRLGEAPARGCQYHDDARGWCGKPVVEVVAWGSLPKRSAYCEKHHRVTHYENSNSSYRKSRPHQTYRVVP